MAIDEKIMHQAIELAKTAESHGDVPVAAIILKDGEIIGQSEPRVMVDSDPTAHAELLAIRSAAATIGSPYLAGCTMYITFECCPMCCGAIMNSGIDTLIIGGRFQGEHRTYGKYSVAELLSWSGADKRIGLTEGIMSEASAEIFTPEKRDDWLNRMRGNNPGWGKQ